ncbi:hypothetical protein [Planctomycetes bacterium TBK1r]|uniref:hypothetical protein n=1 Tax=Stieleria magnilauensis TaxID=2527963 RepID=UPI0011A72B22
MNSETNPYEAPHSGDADVVPDVRSDARTASLVVWIVTLPTHALAFRAGLFFGQFPQGRKSQWELYPIFGESEFGFLFASAIYGGLLAELYRFLTAKAFRDFPDKERVIATVLGMSLFTTFMISIAAVQCIA